MFSVGALSIAFAILLSALLSGMAAPGAWAQTEDPAWIDSNGNPGRVLVSRDGMNEASTPITVNFNGAKSFTYWIKLSALPNRDGVADPEEWWIRIFVDGVNRIDGIYKGIRWVPSVGWYFNQNTWNTWRQITFRVDEDYDEEANGPRATSLTITHEVWATNQWCPLHNASPLNVNVDGNGGGETIDTNNAPVFSDSSATRELLENIGDATATTAANLGAAIRANDADSDPLTYTLEGSDSASFTIVEQTGQLRTKAGVNYNHEAKSRYRFTIRASDSTASDTIAVTVNVTDVDEPPLTPAPPVVSSVANSATSLSVSWTAPANAGRPRITSYDLQYREGTSGPWTDGPQNVTGTSRTIPNLNSDTDYQVQVLARNAEGESGWSGPGSGRTNAPANNAPVFSGTTATRSFQENEGDATTTSAMDLGAAFTATDLDNGDTLIYTLEGPDTASFDFDSQTQHLRTKSGFNYDHEAKPRYSVTVKVDDGTASDTIVVTINVTDLREPPLKPARPSVTPVNDSATSLSVTWTAPSNAGRPPITSYDLQYRETPGGTWRNGPQNVSDTEATITGLQGNREYEVHVRATNAEGDSEWSDPGSAQTVNSAPTFTAETAARTLQEHLGDATETSERNIGGRITASDADANALTYSLENANAFPFTIDSGTGQLKTKIGENYDHEAQPSYTLTVLASDGAASDTIEVTVTIADRNEPPLKPEMPDVEPDSNDSMFLSISWIPPSNDRRPDIAGYNLRYRAGTSGGWTNGPQDVTGTNETLTELSGNTFYQVQVQAKNDEGVSLWSDAGDARTDNTPPEFTAANEDPSFPENLGDATTSSATNIGAPIGATDEDNDTLEYSLAGTDAASFTLDGRTGQLRTKVGVNYSYEARSSYAVRVEADDGTDPVTVDVTIAVEDVNEPPLTPAAPVVSSAPGSSSTTGLSVSWTAPSNAGRPSITGYNLQYRAGTSGSWTNGPQNVSGTSTTIAGLTMNTAYQVQVQASNDEGDSLWSPSGSGRTNAADNNAPEFASADPNRSVQENAGDETTTTAMNLGAAFVASDADNDPLTFSAEGPDARFFTIQADALSVQLKTKSGVTYDHETRPSYSVTLKVSDGTATDTLVVTVNVTDNMDEPPQRPAAPKVRLAPDGQTGLSVSWNAPPNAGRPPITGYNLQCRDRPGPDDTWRNAPPPDPATDTNAILGFNSCDPSATYNEDASYEVRVQAVNADGESEWSPPGRLTSGLLEGDIVQKSWITRFARTVASQVVKALSGRLADDVGNHVTVAGIRTDGSARPEALGIGPGRDAAGWRETPGGRSQRDLLLGSSFQFSAGGEKGMPAWTAWGRFGADRFDATKNRVRLNGDVLTAVVGADVARDRWLAGMAVSISEGGGVFSLPDDNEAGKASGQLTNIYGYGRYSVTETLDVWGLLGYGAGKLKFREEDEQDIEVDLAMRMVATGLRTALLPQEGIGFEVALKADAMWVHVKSDLKDRLVAAAGEVTRLRLLVEGSRVFKLWDGSLRVSAEAGLRHDGGDADTGVGLEFGGGVRYAGPGYTLSGSANGLMVHGERGFKEWGATGSIRIDPGALGRGLSFTVAPTWGAAQGSAPGGMERLQSHRETPGAGPERGFKPEGLLEAEIGYGLRGPHGAGLLTPHAGLSLSGRGTRRWRAGARWRVVPQTTLGFEGSREETRSRDEADHTIMFRASSRW